MQGTGGGTVCGQTLSLLLTFQYGAIASQEEIMVPFGRRQSSVWLLLHVPKDG